MLSSIHPFGERSRNSRWWLTVTAYLTGSIAGGALTGAAFGLVGELLDPVVSPRTALVILGVAAAVGILADQRRFGLRLPGLQRQVNERWLMAYRGWVYGIGFGFQLGLGLATIVITSTVWLTWLAVVLAGSWTTGLLIGGLFGLARGGFIFTTARVDSPDRLRSLHRTIAAQAAPVHQATMALAGATAITALAHAAAW